MGKIFDSVESVREFIAAQHVFFVATAPVSASGHLNLSPKGLDSFRIFGDREVGYVDYNGSGVETIAHLRENARIVLMFCAFSGSPKIVRLWGTGRVVEPSDPDFEESIRRFEPVMTPRSVIRIAVERIGDSCGYSVPRYEYLGERDQLLRWAEKKGEAGIRDYQRRKNYESIDGLPGLPSLRNPSENS
jgi:hypothetical protein